MTDKIKQAELAQMIVDNMATDIQNLRDYVAKLEEENRKLKERLEEESERK